MSGGKQRSSLCLAIGLALTLIHLISIPVTNPSVNPARSTAPALFAGMAYVQQLNGRGGESCALCGESLKQDDVVSEFAASQSDGLE